MKSHFTNEVYCLLFFFLPLAHNLSPCSRTLRDWVPQKSFPKLFARFRGHIRDTRPALSRLSLKRKRITCALRKRIAPALLITFPKEEEGTYVTFLKEKQVDRTLRFGPRLHVTGVDALVGHAMCKIRV